MTLTKRRIYVSRFLARPLGVFLFSCFSTLISGAYPVSHQGPSTASPRCRVDVVDIVEWAAVRGGENGIRDGTIGDRKGREGVDVLRGLRLDFTGARERAVDFSHCYLLLRLVIGV